MNEAFGPYATLSDAQQRRKSRSDKFYAFVSAVLIILLLCGLFYFKHFK